MGVKPREPLPDDPLGKPVEREPHRRQPVVAEASHFYPLRMSVTALAQAAQIVGNSGFEPTSVVYFQHRWHFTPSARSIEMDRSRPLLRHTWETTNSAGRSFEYCSSSGYRSPSAERLTQASSGAPMNFSWRAVSRLFSTSSLNSKRRSQLAMRFRLSSDRPDVSSSGSGNSAVCTLPR